MDANPAFLMELPPTAAVPRSPRSSPDHLPALAPCSACQVPVLTGALPSGRRLVLDVRVPTYVVLWTRGTPVPVLVEGRGYPVHRCASASPRKEPQ